MSTPEVVYKYKLELNKLDSQDFIDLPLPTILGILNKSTLMFVNAIYGIKNIFREGVESSQRRIDDLQEILVNSLPLSNYILNSEIDNSYSTDLPENYLHLLRSYSLADKDICKDRALKNIEYSQDELNDILIMKDPNRYPSFEWLELPFNISTNKIIVYTDGSFTPTKCYLSYLKQPTKMDIAGYTHIDGSTSIDQNCKLADYIMEDIISLSAKFTKAIIGDAEGYQILSNELNTIVQD